MAFRLDATERKQAGRPRSDRGEAQHLIDFFALFSSRAPSAVARQDAAPPEVARNFLDKQCVASGGAASRRAA